MKGFASRDRIDTNGLFVLWFKKAARPLCILTWRLTSSFNAVWRFGERHRRGSTTSPSSPAFLCDGLTRGSSCGAYLFSGWPSPSPTSSSDAHAESIKVVRSWASAYYPWARAGCSCRGRTGAGVTLVVSAYHQRPTFPASSAPSGLMILHICGSPSPLRISHRFRDGAALAATNCVESNRPISLRDRRDAVEQAKTQCCWPCHEQQSSDARNVVSGFDRRRRRLRASGCAGRSAATLGAASSHEHGEGVRSMSFVLMSGSGSGRAVRGVRRGTVTCHPPAVSHRIHSKNS